MFVYVCVDGCMHAATGTVVIYGKISIKIGIVLILNYS